MNYQETIEWLFTQLPVFQRDGAKAYKANLNNTLALDSAMNHPHNHYKTIHVAGTNGKGSTSHLLTSILMEAGYKVGLYTSPHLKDFTERISINGTAISQDYVTKFVAEYKNIITSIGPSFFEITVAMALKYFEASDIDIAVIETGMGGRLDSTNIISPELSIITNISLDHTEFLGNTIAEIAREKAGIIKPKTPIVIGRAEKEIRHVFSHKAETLDAPIFYAEDQYTIKNIRNENEYLVIQYSGALDLEYECPLTGMYQQENIRTAFFASQILSEKGLVTTENIRKGIMNINKNAPIKGRWQTLSIDPHIICDTAHNYDGIRIIAEQLMTLRYGTLHIIWGMVGDKDVTKIIPLLPRNAKYYLCAAPIARAMPVFELEKYFKKEGLSYQTTKSCADALTVVKNNYIDNDLIFIGGSTFTVAEFV